MYERKIPENLECGISIALKVLGGKWKSLIIDKIYNGVKRPSQIHKEITGTPPRVINLHLKELEELGIVSRTIYPELPPKVEYSLTALGESVIPVLQTMEKWGAEKRSYFTASIQGSPE